MKLALPPLLLFLGVCLVVAPAQAQERTQDAPPDVVAIDHEGRYKLLATTTVLGGLEGFMVPLALGVESSRVINSLGFAGAAAGFFVPFVLTRDYPVPEAQAVFTLYGGAQGASQGLALAFLLGGVDTTPEAAAALTGSMAAAQASLGYVLSDRWDLTAGTGELLAYGSTFGGYTGVMVLTLVDENNVTMRGGAAAALLGSLAGNGAGWWLSRQEHYTQGDARILARTGLLGVQAGFRLLPFIVPSTTSTSWPKTMGLLQLGGVATGLGVGYLLSRNRDFSRSEANVISLGSLAGMLLGYGVGYAVAADGRTSGLLSLLGGIGGFGFTYSTYSDDAAERVDLGVRMQMRPTLLYAYASGGTRGAVKSVPGVNLSVTF